MVGGFALFDWRIGNARTHVVFLCLRSKNRETMCDQSYYNNSSDHVCVQENRRLKVFCFLLFDWRIGNTRTHMALPVSLVKQGDHV